ICKTTDALRAVRILPGHTKMECRMDVRAVSMARSNPPPVLGRARMFAPKAPNPPTKAAANAHNKPLSGRELDTNRPTPGTSNPSIGNGRVWNFGAVPVHPPSAPGNAVTGKRLTVGSADDARELEADRLAGAAMRMPEPVPSVMPALPRL